MKKNYITMAVFAAFLLGMLLLPTQSTSKVDLVHTLEGMSAQHWLGTDNLGRDILSLMVQGCWRTLTVVLTATAVSLGVGAVLGVIAGYIGGGVETAIQFLADFTMIVPSFIVALIFSAVGGLSPGKAGIMLGLTGVGAYINQMIILTKHLKNEEFIVSEVIVGMPDYRIIFFHILPNLKNALLTFMSNKAGFIILNYAALAYIGLGTDITNPDWGTMVYQYQIYIVSKPSLLFWPVFGIFVLSLFFHLMFDNKNAGKRVSIYE